MLKMKDVKFKKLRNYWRILVSCNSIMALLVSLSFYSANCNCPIWHLWTKQSYQTQSKWISRNLNLGFNLGHQSHCFTKCKAERLFWKVALIWLYSYLILDSLESSFFMFIPIDQTTGLADLSFYERG